MPHHYGLKIGDKVKFFDNPKRIGVVTDYAGFDNNGCYVLENGDTEPYRTVCEYWEKIEEDK